MKYTFLGLLLVIVLSCKKEINESAIKGRINEIVIDFVKVKRDWCRFSNITFKAEVLNNSKDTLHLNNYGEIDFCDLPASKCGYITRIETRTRPEIWNISNANQTVHVTLLKKPKLILPFKSATLEFTISEKIMGLSLKEVHRNYEWILNSDFKIICDSLFSNNHHQIAFIKKDNISKMEFIDDIPQLVRASLNKQHRHRELLARGHKDKKQKSLFALLVSKEITIFMY